jgi:hypothetical protein
LKRLDVNVAKRFFFVVTDVSSKKKLERFSVKSFFSVRIKFVSKARLSTPQSKYRLLALPEYNTPAGLVVDIPLFPGGGAGVWERGGGCGLLGTE